MINKKESQFIKKFMGTVGFFIVLILCAYPAYASDIDTEAFKKPLPVYDFLPDAEFEKNTAQYQETPYLQDFLTYQVRLPTGWNKRDAKNEEFTLASEFLNQVVKYDSPIQEGGVRSRFVMQAMKLQNNTTAEQWYLRYISSRGYSLIGTESYGDKKTESVYAKIEGDTTFIIRGIAMINGRQLILVEYFLPQQFWQQQRALQNQVMNSFRLLNEDTERIEKLLKFRFLDIAELDYPKTWKTSAPPLKRVEIMELQLNNLGRSNKIRGQINIDVVSAGVSKPIDEEIIRMRTELKDKTILMDVYPFEIQRENKIRKNMNFGVAEIYGARNKEDESNRFEVWIGLLSSQEYYYYLSMITPSRDEDFFVWSENMNAFKDVFASIGPQASEQSPVNYEE